MLFQNVFCLLGVFFLLALPFQPSCRFQWFYFDFTTTIGWVDDFGILDIANAAASASSTLRFFACKTNEFPLCCPSQSPSFEKAKFRLHFCCVNFQATEQYRDSICSLLLMTARVNMQDQEKWTGDLSFRFCRFLAQQKRTNIKVVTHSEKWFRGLISLMINCCYQHNTEVILLGISK